MNSKAHRYAVILLLIGVVLIAGCSSSKDSQEGIVSEAVVTSGLSIASFSTDQSVRGGDTIDVNINLENVGEADAEDIKINLYQTSGFVFPPSSDSVLIKNSIKRADVKLNIPGETHYAYWTLRAPYLQSDQTKNFLARLTYNYSSIGSVNINLVDRELADEQGESAFHAQPISSSAPVTISLVPQPVSKMNTKSSTTKRLTQKIVFENTGSGHVVDDTVRNVEILVDGEVFDECKSITSLKLFGTDQQRSAECTLSLTYDPPSTTHLIEVTADYTYELDTPALTTNVRYVKPAEREEVYYCYGDVLGSRSGSTWVLGPSGSYTVAKWPVDCVLETGLSCTQQCGKQGFSQGSINCPIPLNAKGKCEATAPESAYCLCTN